MLKAIRRFISKPFWFVDCDPLWGVVEAFSFGQCLAV